MRRRPHERQYNSHVIAWQLHRRVPRIRPSRANG
jgi:hypothetical protein